jgi:hypothetical protein
VLRPHTAGAAAKAARAIFSTIALVLATGPCRLPFEADPRGACGMRVAQAKMLSLRHDPSERARKEINHKPVHLVRSVVLHPVCCVGQMEHLPAFAQGKAGLG